MGATSPQRDIAADDMLDWAEAHIQIARMTLTIKLDRTCDSFKLANTAPSAKRRSYRYCPFRKDACKL